MKRAVLTLFLALAACSGGRSDDTQAPLQSIVGFDAGAADGLWAEVAAIGRTPGTTWRITPNSDGTLTLIAAGLSGTAQPVGPGQYDLNGTRLVVIWAETTYRTLILATPDRSFAAVLNRDWDLPADRARVVREILEWNGYDTRLLNT